MKKIAFAAVIALALPSTAFATGFHYCGGVVTGLVTRGTTEVTQVRIEGMVGWAQIDFGGDAFEAMHQRQFSMLLAAYLAGKPVTLEFVDQVVTRPDPEDSNQTVDVTVDDCTVDHRGVSVRYVLLQ